MPLQWSEVRDPDKTCPYTHVVSDTPLGRLVIDWKGWKDSSAPTCMLPWGQFVLGNDVDKAKAAVQAAWDTMAAEVMTLAVQPPR